MKKMPSVIHILIEEHKEDGITYFLGTSPELEGFLVEGNTIEEIKQEAPGVIKAFIEAINETEENKKNAFIKSLVSSRILNVSYNWDQELALA